MKICPLFERLTKRRFVVEEIEDFRIMLTKIVTALLFTGRRTEDEDGVELVEGMHHGENLRGRWTGHDEKDRLTRSTNLFETFVTIGEEIDREFRRNSFLRRTFVEPNENGRSQFGSFLRVFTDGFGRSRRAHRTDEDRKKPKRNETTPFPLFISLVTIETIKTLFLRRSDLCSIVCSESFQLDRIDLSIRTA